MQFKIILFFVLTFFLSLDVLSQNPCSSFVGKWATRDEIFTITQDGNIFKMAYKGPNYSSNEACPCKDGQLENETMKMTYLPSEDVFYWDGRKFKRIGTKPAISSQPSSGGQIVTSESVSCDNFIGIWKTPDEKFIISKDGPIYKLNYSGPNHNTLNASVCNNGQLEVENMKLTYSPNDKAFFWDGRMFKKDQNTIISRSQGDNGGEIIMPKEVNLASFRGFLIDEQSRYAIQIKSVVVNDELNRKAVIQSKIIEYLQKLKRLNQPPSNINDTLNFTAEINFSYRNLFANGANVYFADYTLIFKMSESKNSATLFQNTYNGTNYSLLAKGFNSKLEAENNIIFVELEQVLSQFIIGNFPIKATITEVIETSRKKDEAKIVKIDVGRDQGIYIGFEFLISELNSEAKKGDLVVKEVYDTYSICKVAENEKKVLELFNTGQKIKVKTKYKP